jgi:molybdopterin synthase sulfur carrier subunit
VKVNFYATYRQVVGGKTVDLLVPDGISVRQLVDEIVKHYPKLGRELLDEHGELYSHVHVFVNGRDTPYLVEGMETRLSPDDTVNVFPPVAGGAV